MFIIDQIAVSSTTPSQLNEAKHIAKWIHVGTLGNQNPWYLSFKVSSSFSYLSPIRILIPTSVWVFTVITPRIWHTLSTEDLFRRLESTPLGLTQDQVNSRLLKGKNSFQPRRPSLVSKAFSCVFGGFGSLIFISAILSFLSWWVHCSCFHCSVTQILKSILPGNHLDMTRLYVTAIPSHLEKLKPWRICYPTQHPTAKLGLGIVLLIILLVQACFKAWQLHITGRAMRSITDHVGHETSVLRDGGTRTIPSDELVPGDLVKVGSSSHSHRHVHRLII